MARPAAGFLVVLTALLALPLQAEAQTEVWSGTLTVRDLGFSLLGCSNTVATSHCSSRLTDDDFTHDSTDYAVDFIFLRTNGQLEIEFDTDLTTATQGLTLNVDGTAFAFEDADSKLAAVRVWFNSGLSWSAGDTVSLTLIEPADATLSDLVLEDNAGAGITLTPTFVTGTTSLHGGGGEQRECDHADADGERIQCHGRVSQCKQRGDHRYRYDHARAGRAAGGGSQHVQGEGDGGGRRHHRDLQGGSDAGD